jgi:hypothetical protein
MSMRLRSALLAAVTMFIGGVAPFVGAKPPDLPLDPKVTCEPPAAEQFGGCLTIEEINIESGDAWAEEPADGSPCVDNAFTCCWQAFCRWLHGKPVRAKRPIKVEQIPVMPTLIEDSDTPPAKEESDNNVRMEQLLIEAEDLRQIANEWQHIWITEQPSPLTPTYVHDGIREGEPAATEPATPTCPYLKQKAAEKAAKEAAAAAAMNLGTPLENLAKLEKARHLYRQGAYYFSLGKFNAARTCYEQVHLLCPGSGYDRLALEGLVQVEKAAGAAAPATRPVGEEQDSAPPASSKPQGEVLRPSLPPIDHHLVTVLEKVLCSKATTKVTVTEDEPPLAEGCEDPSEPPDVLGQMIQQALDVLRGGSCIDVDVSRAGDMRAQYETHLGGVHLKIVYKRTGGRGIGVGFGMHAVPVHDLQAEQRRHYARILHWIETVSGNGNTVEEK